MQQKASEVISNKTEHEQSQECWSCSL